MSILSKSISLYISLDIFTFLSYNCKKGTSFYRTALCSSGVLVSFLCLWCHINTFFIFRMSYNRLCIKQMSLSQMICKRVLIISEWFTIIWQISILPGSTGFYSTVPYVKAWKIRKNNLEYYNISYLKEQYWITQFLCVFLCAKTTP